VNFIEDKLADDVRADGSIELRPHEIRTLKISTRPPGARQRGENGQ
jgi:hypothetical protein